MTQQTTKPQHNHASMDVKRRGDCPACDLILATLPPLKKK